MIDKAYVDEIESLTRQRDDWRNSAYAWSAKADSHATKAQIFEQERDGGLSTMRMIGDALKRTVELQLADRPDDVAWNSVGYFARQLLAAAGLERPAVTARFVDPSGERAPGEVTIRPACSGCTKELPEGFWHPTVVGALCYECFEAYSAAGAMAETLGARIAERRARVDFPGDAIGRCERCATLVGTAERDGLPAGYVTARGVMCRVHRDEAYPSDAVPAAADLSTVTTLATCPTCRRPTYAEDGVLVSHTAGGWFVACTGSGREVGE